ncbi:arylsulfatase [Arenibacter sp. 6A1]|uniref:arylsulfatase n=1 Tax=Arenibacter sp. 6A1 TaxID=2720391 RepID=UPI0014451384|nr:arylsulfatase [Arenibacter sp. 6A1]NKI25336.1 arylsulfatase [Arenibacter sp. 6A1]
MNRLLSNFYLLGAFIVLLSSCKEEKKELSVQNAAQKPNIIYILADDLGYAELGAYGQEKIETPNIDALAKNGMLFTQHYTGAPVCAPARYNLLTGKHSGHSYVRGNDEWRERGEVWDYVAAIKDSTLEGQRPIPMTTVTIANKLKEAGYATGMVGKWGLGAPHTESVPTNFGFDYFFGFNCQRQAHTYYPVHLYENNTRVYLNNDTIAPNVRLDKGADPYKEASYAKYNLNDYASELIFDKITQFVDNNKNKPFFMYWADPIPHAPLQAPKRWVDYYIEKFGDEEPYLGERSYFPHKNPRAAYAAMVSYLDENVGKLVAQLKKEGIYENTLIMFTSDNGPTYNGGTDSPWFKSAEPFRSEYGYGKGFLYEGGIRIPMIASWPGKIKAGTTTDHISAHYDVMATLTELTGQSTPDDTDGISFLPTLLGAEEKQKQHEFLFWEYPEYGGQVAIRMGDWKVLRRNLKNKKEAATLELYNLKDDVREENNLAEQHPEILEKAAAIFAREHQNAEVENFRIPMIENGLLHQ